MSSGVSVIGPCVCLGDREPTHDHDKMSERLAAVERRCQENASVKAGKYEPSGPFCKTDMR